MNDAARRRASRRKLGRAGGVELTFLGTRGEIDIASRIHRRHSALLITRGASRVMIDCGTDWRGRLKFLAPDAILLTHAHPDHAEGLRDGAPCPVYATRATFVRLRRFPIGERRIIVPRRPFRIAGMQFEAFPVAHSLRAPAVGFRITTARSHCFYVPDVVAIKGRSAALRGVGLYIGDGASLRRPILRQRDGKPIGHSAIVTQLGWCRREGVRRAIFTHCGSGIVRSEATSARAAVRSLGHASGVDARLAHDGLKIDLRGRKTRGRPRRRRT